MTPNQQTQTPTKKDQLFLKVKVDRDITRYKAWVGNYMVRGWTAGGREAVEEVVTRMAEAKVDLIDKIKSLVTSMANNVVAASESGAVDIGMAMGTFFYLGEYLAVMVKIQRVTHPRASSRWWGQVRITFKGFDGHKALSKHVVERYVEFYTDKVDRNKLYSVLYEAARLAFNAYGHLPA
jgi:hypothetical protein